jgi:hypothetical protein
VIIQHLLQHQTNEFIAVKWPWTESSYFYLAEFILLHQFLLQLGVFSSVRRRLPHVSLLREVTQNLAPNPTFIIYKNLHLHRLMEWISEFNRVTTCNFLCHQVQWKRRVDKSVCTCERLKHSYILLFTSYLFLGLPSCLKIYYSLAFFHFLLDSIRILNSCHSVFKE